MSSNEEYLDSLLKTIIEEDDPQKNLAAESEMVPNAEEIENISGTEPLEQGEPDMTDQTNVAAEEIDTAVNGGDANTTIDNDPNHKMSAEEIEAMFAALDAEDSGADDVGLETDDNSDGSEDVGFGLDDDMMSLLDNGLSMENNADEENADSEFDFFSMDDTGAQEEPHEMDDDMTALLENGESAMPDMEMDITQLLENAEAEAAAETQAAVAEVKQPEQDKPARKRKREKKVKEAKTENKEKGDKKPGFLSRLFTILVGEEDENPETGSIDGYNMDAENQSLMKELADVSPKKQTVKKEKKVKDKKPKKEKAPKEKKEKKVKTPKEPKVKAPVIPEKKGRPLPKKRVAAIVCMGATVLAAILLLTIYLPEIMEKRKAEAAYAAQNYAEAFNLLQGKELQGEEKTTYRRTLLIVQMEKQLEAYENYLKMNMPLEALNALVKGVDKYEKGLEAARQYHVENQTNKVYMEIMTILQNEYGVTEDGVREILSQKDDVYYTIALKQVLGEEIPGLTEGNESQTAEPEEQSEPDILPEEELLENAL